MSCSQSALHVPLIAVCSPPWGAQGSRGDRQAPSEAAGTAPSAPQLKHRAGLAAQPAGDEHPSGAAEMRDRLDSDDLNGSKPPAPALASGSAVSGNTSWCRAPSPEACSGVRHAILAAYFMYACFRGALAVGAAPLLVVSALCYVLAFGMAVFVDEAGHSREPVIKGVPHHTPGIWSLHEDFHVMLLLADVSWLLLSMRHLYPGLSALHFAEFAL